MHTAYSAADFQRKPSCAIGGCTCVRESQAGAQGIPECTLPIWQQIFKENHHAPIGGCTCVRESQAGAQGIPECMLPIRQQIFKENHHAPIGGCTCVRESQAGAQGIPECILPIRQQIFKENHHAPIGGCTYVRESQAGALGIPECMLPIRQQIFKEKKGSEHTFMKNRIRKLAAWLLMTLLVICMAAGCADGRIAGQENLTSVEYQPSAGSEEMSDPQESSAGAEETSDPQESPVGPEKILDPQESPAGAEETSDLQESSAGTDSPGESAIEESGSYTSRDEVALYLHTYGCLPDNYITKKDAEVLGWDSRQGNLWEVAPGMSIGGSRFGNYEGLLPDKKGRKYFECDIDYEGGYRGAKRIIYSNDGLIFYTEDHYKTFDQLY